jgi:hypothetical protein
MSGVLLPSYVIAPQGAVPVPCDCDASHGPGVFVWGRGLQSCTHVLARYRAIYGEDPMTFAPWSIAKPMSFQRAEVRHD